MLIPVSSGGHAHNTSHKFRNDVGDQLGGQRRLVQNFANKNNAFIVVYGGGSGIRTLGGLSPSSVFKTGAFDHSAKPPLGAL